jgi:hypothetical protein
MNMLTSRKLIKHYTYATLLLKLLCLLELTSTMKCHFIPLELKQIISNHYGKWKCEKELHTL